MIRNDSLLNGVMKGPLDIILIMKLLSWVWFVARFRGTLFSRDNW